MNMEDTLSVTLTLYEWVAVISSILEDGPRFMILDEIPDEVKDFVADELGRGKE